MDLNKAIIQIEQAILNSNEFKEFKRAKAIIDNNKQMNELIQNFHKKQQLLYEGNMSQSQTQNLMDVISSDYQKISEIPEIARYFTAGEKLNSLMGQVTQKINMAIENHI